MASIYRFFFSAPFSDSTLPAKDLICAGVALPVFKALPATLASDFDGGFSGVVLRAKETSSGFKRTDDIRVAGRAFEISEISTANRFLSGKALSKSNIETSPNEA